MQYIIEKVRIHHPDGREEVRDLVFSSGQLSFAPQAWQEAQHNRISGRDLHLFPGFTDVHVHLREPGFSYKETMATGSRAAARGGFTNLITMPNLKPVPDSLAHVNEQLRLIREDAVVRVIPLGAITKAQQGEQLAELAELAPFVAGYSDDGRGIQRDEMMLAAMAAAKELGKPIVAHCEDEALTNGGWIHDGEWARNHGHTGNPSESEWRQVERDLLLAEQSGCKYHVCHVSAKESVALIRAAKARGVDVTCETAPHYLALDDSDLQDLGRFKMNPPIRAKEDQEALIAGLIDGTVDMIATDHAPHSAQEKAGGLRHSMNGVVGLETAFAVLYTALVKTGKLSLARLIDSLSTAPNARFGITSQDDWTLFDLGVEYTIDPEEFLSLGRATPFEGHKVFGRCLLTMASGQAVWVDKAVFSGEDAI